jgi:hypothetical protein
MEPPPLPPPPRFRPSVAVWIIWGILFVGMIGMSLLRPETFGAERWARFVGGAILGPIVLAWIVWRIAGRSRLASSLTFYLAIAGGILGPSAWHYGKMFFDFSTTSQRDQPVVEEVEQTLNASVQEAGRRNKAALEAAQLDTFFDFSSVTVQSQLQDRRLLVQAAKAANDDLMTVFRDREKTLRAELEKRGVSTAMIELTLFGYRKGNGPDLPLNLEMRAADGRFYQELLATLDLLDAQWGQWKAEGRKVTFTDAEAAKAYNDELGKVRAISDEETDLRRQLAALGK